MHPRRSKTFWKTLTTKQSTIIKHGKDLYKLGKLANLSDSEIKKLLNRWIKKSNINYDVDMIFNAISNSKTELSSTDFYKALSHLGYSRERYDNLKNRSFYKSLSFKRFIKNCKIYERLRQLTIS